MGESLQYFQEIFDHLIGFADRGAMRFGREFAIFGRKDDQTGYRQIDFFHLKELLQKTDMFIQLHAGIFHDGFFYSRINAEKLACLFIKMKLAIDVFGLDDDREALSEQQAIHLNGPAADFQADIPKDLELFLRIKLVELFLQAVFAPCSGRGPVEFQLKKRPLRMLIRLAATQPVIPAPSGPDRR